ncbi:MAG: nitrate/nitrite transporter NrtS [Limisphaerales bacterium]
MLARALKVSLLVGTALNLINSGDHLLTGQLPPRAWKIPLTYVVPFLVSFYSSAAERRKSTGSQTRRHNTNTQPKQGSQP